MGKRPPTIYLANAPIAQNNRLSGSAYGIEHIEEKEKARSILMELNRRNEIPYTPEAIHMAFGPAVRNFIDLVEEGVRRMLRVTGKGGRCIFGCVLLTTT